MTPVVLEVSGRGAVEVEAHGPADAEHRLEREVGAAWPAARVTVVRMERLDDPDRLVGAYRLEYAVRGRVEVQAPASGSPARAAFRSLRDRFSGTRFRGIEWIRAEPVERDPAR